mmetsp:Transcript_55390/g.109836  ORF Transcript_55390/g.109836 Transcript_55390/m.109836 type:complete len:89 (+) Transcript_55390:397-663(+)
MYCCPEAQLKGNISLWQRVQHVSQGLSHFHLSLSRPKTLGKLVQHMKQTTASEEMNKLSSSVTGADIQSGASDIIFLSLSKRRPPPAN